MARKAKLPFLVEPKRQPIIEELGSDEMGYIRIARKGYLTVSEKSFMQQSTSGDSALMGIQRLTAKAARESGRDQADLMQEVSRGDFGDPAWDSYREELEEVIGQLAAMDSRQKIIAVTCLLLMRCSSEWSVEQTLDLHPDLIDEVYALYIEEDARSMDAFKALDSQQSPASSDASGKEEAR